MDTLALDTTLWDLDVDAQGNWRTIGDATPGTLTGPGMRLAQDVATQCLTWLGECYFDTTQGIRYITILGHPPNMSLLQSAFTTEALKVPLCQSALVNFQYNGGAQRSITGSLTVSDINANTAAVSLT